MDERQASVTEMVEALLLFDEPILNSRFHAMISRRARGKETDALTDLPQRVTHAQNAARLSALEWVRTRSSLDDEFVERGERALLESFLRLAESQLRLLAFMARSAPTQEAREGFDEAADLQREVAGVLRGIIKRMAAAAVTDEPPSGSGRSTRSVQLEGGAGDLRGQLEAAVRNAQASGGGACTITVSHTALRHLRDQGAFKNGESTFMGVPVKLDLQWEGSVFAVNSYDVVPLEEIQNGDPPGG